MSSSPERGSQRRYEDPDLKFNREHANNKEVLAERAKIVLAQAAASLQKRIDACRTLDDIADLLGVIENFKPTIPDLRKDEEHEEWYLKEYRGDQENAVKEIQRDRVFRYRVVADAAVLLRKTLAHAGDSSTEETS